MRMLVQKQTAGYIDMELSFVDVDDVIDVNERSLKKLSGKCWM